MSVTINGIATSALPDLGTATDTSKLVADKAGTGTLLMTALRDYVVPLTDLGVMADASQVAAPGGRYAGLAIRNYVFNGAMQTGIGLPFAPGQDGNQWGHTPYLFQSNTTGGHSGVAGDARSAMAVLHVADGSGVNGPLNCDVGLFVGASKTNYLTSAVQGEVDGVYVFSEQGKLGDGSGMLVSASRVDGGTGFAGYGQLAIEAGVDLLAPTTGTVTARIKTIIGWSFTGSTTNERYGFVTEARIAPSKAAFLVDTFDESGGANVPSWAWAFLYRQGRNDAARLFGVDGSGRIMLGAYGTTRAVYTAGSGSIAFRNMADTTITHQFGNDSSIVAGQIAPLTDNIFSLGVSGLRYTAVWAVNGTIQTSDPALKTDIAPLPTVLPLLDAVDPVTFRWKADGRDADTADRRLHWGFMAPELKAAFDGIGMDWGGYVKGEDGSHNLRPDQLIPVLWKALQELKAELAAMRAAAAL